MELNFTPVQEYYICSLLIRENTDESDAVLLSIIDQRMNRRKMERVEANALEAMGRYYTEEDKN